MRLCQCAERAPVLKEGSELLSCTASLQHCPSCGSSSLCLHLGVTAALRMPSHPGEGQGMCPAEEGAPSAHQGVMESTLLLSPGHCCPQGIAAPAVGSRVAPVKTCSLCLFAVQSHRQAGQQTPCADLSCCAYENAPGLVFVAQGTQDLPAFAVSPTVSTHVVSNTCLLGALWWSDPQVSMWTWWSCVYKSE